MNDALLEAHGLTQADLDLAALAKVSPGDEEGLMRVIRMAVTNRELRKHGGTPLTLSEKEEKEEGRPPPPLLGDLGTHLGLTADEREALARIPGMTLELYLAIRGRYGTLMGLRLSEDAFARARRVCHNKGALRLRDDPDASRAYLAERLCTIARAMRIKAAPKKSHQHGGGGTAESAAAS